MGLPLAWFTFVTLHWIPAVFRPLVCRAVSVHCRQPADRIGLKFDRSCYFDESPLCHHHHHHHHQQQQQSKWFTRIPKYLSDLIFILCFLTWTDDDSEYGRIRYERHQAGISMMTSSNGNIFRVTGPLCGNHRWIPRAKADAELWCFLWSAWMNDWVNNREAGDLSRHRANYDVTVMVNISGIRIFWWAKTYSKSYTCGVGIWWVNTLWLEQNSRHFANDFSNAFSWKKCLGPIC